MKKKKRKQSEISEYRVEQRKKVLVKERIQTIKNQ